MDRNNNEMSQKQVHCEIKKLVEGIQSFKGSSGHEEVEWRLDQQALLKLLSEYPLSVYSLEESLKNEVRSIVDSYLTWSFSGWW